MTGNHYTGHSLKNTTGTLHAVNSPEEPDGGGGTKNDR
jgi:hypothetical protein